MALNINRIVDHYNFSEEERQILEVSGSTPNIAENNQSRVVSEFILGREMRGLGEQIMKSVSSLESNLASNTDKIIESNKKHATAMRWLTGALVLVGFLQIFLPVVL